MSDTPYDPDNAWRANTVQFEYPVPVEPYDVANPRINADPVFNAQLKALLKADDTFPEERLRRQAGALRSIYIERNPEGHISLTAMQCYEDCMHAGMRVPEGLRDKVERVGVVKKRGDPEADARDMEFKRRWQEYIQQCQALKERKAQANTLYEVEVAEAKARRDAVLNERPPTPPKRDA